MQPNLFSNRAQRGSARKGLLFLPRWPVRWSGVAELTCVLFGQATTAAGALYGVRVLTEMIPPETFGQFMLAMTAVTLAHQVCFGPLGSAAQRFFGSARETDQFAVYGYVLVRMFIASAAVVFVATGLAAAGLRACQYATAADLLWAAGSFAVVAGGASFLDAVHAAARWRLQVAWHQALTQCLRWTWAGYAAMAWAPTASMALWGATLAVAAMTLVRLLTSGKLLGVPNRAVSHPTVDWSMHLWGYCWPLAAWGVFTWLGTVSDRWALAAFTAQCDVGQYAAVYQISYFPTVLLGEAVQQFLAPILFSRMSVGTSAQHRYSALRWYSRASLLTAVAFLILCVMGACFARLIVRYAVAHAYQVPWDWFASLLVAGSLFALGQVLALAIMAAEGSAALLPAKVTSAVVTVVANFCGAWMAGARGVVLAMPLTAGVYVVWCVWLFARVTRTAARQATLLPSQQAREKSVQPESSDSSALRRAA